MQVTKNVLINKAGGTAGKNSVNYRISLPVNMVREIGVSSEDRAVVVKCEDKKIIIEKLK